MRTLTGTGLVLVLTGCQSVGTPKPAEAVAPMAYVEVSGTLGSSGECGFLRTTDGKLFDYYVPEFTRFGGRDTPDRYTLPNGSIAEIGKPYRFLVEVGKNKPICHETALTIRDVLPP